ncbi:MAG: alkyl hydroperoxide reductase [Woeseia sp.]|nr:alkyl hydroperoxide reductase [Woeseia sp.]|tara:strand:+ start:848 stop:1438 length:591 start_codon:yes stop_codon:yes gene_type:complete
MNRKILLSASLIILIFSATITYTIREDSTEDIHLASPQTNITLANFALPDLNGVIRNSSEWNGKARLINFWATWCAPCRREIPLLKKTQTEQSTNNIQVIGIAVDFVEEVTLYAQDAKFNYPVLIGQEDAMEIAETSGIEFIGMPFTMIVAPSGELIATHIGEIIETHIEQILSVLQDLERGEIDLVSAREVLKKL